MKYNCILCDADLDLKHSHNAMPLADGLCCDDCNELGVIPARMQILDQLISIDELSVDQVRKISEIAENVRNRRWMGSLWGSPSEN